MQKSPLFDAAWYLATYEDIHQAGVDPLVHYLETGGFEARNPSRYFDSAWYLATYPDIAEAGLNPLVHFLESGYAEGRLPLAANRLVALQHDVAYTRHKMTFSVAEEADRANALDLIRGSRLFNAKWYINTYPDVAESNVDPAEHYLIAGATENRSPGPDFDAEWYKSINPEAAHSSMNPLVHYLQFGQEQGFEPTMPAKPRRAAGSKVKPAEAKSSLESTTTASPPSREEQYMADAELVRESDLFDEKWYLKTYTAVAKNGYDPALHYVRAGGMAGNNPSIHFDSEYYLGKVPELRQQGINPLVHYLKEGRAQGLKPLAVLDFVSPEPGMADKPTAALSLPSTWPLQPNEAHILIDQIQLGICPVSEPNKKNAFASIRPYLDPILAFCALSGHAKKPMCRYMGSSRPRINEIENDADPALVRTFAARATSGAIVEDAWLATEYDLRLRYTVAPGVAGAAGRLVRLYQFDAAEGAPLQMLAQVPLPAEGVAFVDAALANPYMPVLIVVTDAAGLVFDTTLLPFPALCRGGAYHGELSFAATTPSPFKRLQQYSDSLLHEWMDNRADVQTFAIGALWLDNPQLVGTERIFVPSLLAWLSRVMHLTCALKTPETISDDDTRAYLVQALAVPALGEAMQAAVDARRKSGGLDLVLAGNSLPSLAAMVSRRLTLDGDRAAGSYIFCNGVSAKPKCVVTLPPFSSDLIDLRPITAAAGYPVLTRGAAASPFATGRVVPGSIPLALQFQSLLPDNPIDLAFPRIAGEAPLLSRTISPEDRAKISISVIVTYRPEDDLPAFAAALKAQTLSDRIGNITFVRQTRGPRDSKLEKSLDVFFTDPEYVTGVQAINLAVSADQTATPETSVLLCDASVIMTDKRTLEVLHHLSALPQVATSSCVIVREQTTRRDTKVTLVSGGYFPWRFSLTGNGGIQFKQLDVLAALPDMTYPVVANAFRLTLVRTDVWKRLNGIDTARFPGALQDLDFCLRAVAAGMRHLCTSSVRGICRDTFQPPEIVDATAEDFLPLMQWQDVLRTCTLIREIL